MGKRVPVYLGDHVFGSFPASFDPRMIRSRSWLYIPRPGDFTRHKDGWKASWSLGPGDIEAVEGFGPAPLTTTKEAVDDVG